MIQQQQSSWKIAIYDEKGGIKTTLTNNTIHIDDSISTLKNKILIQLENPSEYNYEDIYLFYKTDQLIDVQRVFQNLTHNETAPLTKEKLGQFLLNFNRLDDEILEKLEEKQVYFYEDLANIGLHNSIQTVKLPLGRRFVGKRADADFCVNPFEIPDFENAEKKQLLAFENELLLNYPPIKDNTIYCCFAKDVFAFLTTMKKITQRFENCISPSCLKTNTLCRTPFPKKSTKPSTCFMVLTVRFPCLI